MRHGWGSTYSLSVEEGKGGIHQPWACGMDGAALTSCQLRRGRAHSSALGMRHGWGSTYILSVEQGQGAFISPGHAAWMGQHLHPVSWAREGSIHQPWAWGMDGAALTRCQLRRGRAHSSALGMRHGWGSTYSLSVEEAFISPGHAAWMGQHLQSVS